MRKDSFNYKDLSPKNNGPRFICLGCRKKKFLGLETRILVEREHKIEEDGYATGGPNTIRSYNFKEIVGNVCDDVCFSVFLLKTVGNEFKRY